MYENRFKKFLIEQDEELTDDQVAAQQTLDKGTELADFDVQTPDVPAGEASMTGIQRKMYDELKTWITELDRFSTFLNGTDPTSVQSKLNAAEAETLFDKISTAETKKIARVAVEVSSLSEMFKGYLATVNDPKYKYT